MSTIPSFAMSGTLYPTTQLNNPEDFFSNTAAKTSDLSRNGYITMQV
jgi:hypothetical protein